MEFYYMTYLQEGDLTMILIFMMKAFLIIKLIKKILKKYRFLKSNI